MNIKKTVIQIDWCFPELMNPPKSLNIPEGTKVYDDKGELSYMLVEITDNSVFNNYIEWMKKTEDYLYIFVEFIASDTIYFRLDAV